MHTGGIVNHNLLKESIDVVSGKYRRWVFCPQCGNLFETYQKEYHNCLRCDYQGKCDTIIQTIKY